MGNVAITGKFRSWGIRDPGSGPGRNRNPYYSRLIGSVRGPVHRGEIFELRIDSCTALGLLSDFVIFEIS